MKDLGSTWRNSNMVYVRFSPKRVTLLALAAVVPLLGACGKDNVLSPQFQPEVANQTDTFQFQATGVTNVTQTLTYSWPNTGVAANIDQSCTVTTGSATIQIRDSQGTLVYERTLADGGSFVSQDGVTGNWAIRVILSNYDGTLNFRVQKKT
jgi:hypothetical protein